MQTTIRSLRALGACCEAVEWAETQPDAATAWATCPRGEWMLWLLTRLRDPRIRDVPRWCALRALRIHAPAALDAAADRASGPRAATLCDHAATLRALPDDCDLRAAADDAAAAAHRAANAAVDAAAAHRAAVAARWAAVDAADDAATRWGAAADDAHWAAAAAVDVAVAAANNARWVADAAAAAAGGGRAAERIALADEIRRLVPVAPDLPEAP